MKLILHYLKRYKGLLVLNIIAIFGFALVELWEELEHALASREAKPEETGNFLSQEVASWLTGG